MQIHELNAQLIVDDADVFAIDNGTTTNKVSASALGKKITEDATPSFTSGDSSSATAWTSVTAVTSGLPFKTILNRITTMMKNVRYLYKLLGTTDISAIGGGTVTDILSANNTLVGNSDISDIGDGTVTGILDIINTLIGSTNISSVGDGTVTGAISKINTDLLTHAAIADCNTALNNGIYNINANSSNRPTNYAVMFVMKYSASYVVQLAMRVNTQTPTLYIRSNSDNGFSNWVQIN